MQLLLHDNARLAYRVRTRSSGARRIPVATAAVPATNKEAHGYGDAMSTSRSMSSLTPRSGTLNMALRKLLDQFSRSDCRTVYRKVAFEPFHTPHGPSFCQSAESTLLTDPGCRMSRNCSGGDGFLGDLGDWSGDSARRPFLARE